MKVLYLDLFSGISGDMFIGALLDLGVEPQKLEEGLSRLKLGGYHVHVDRGFKGSIAGTKFDVHLEGEAEHGHGAGVLHYHGSEAHAHGHARAHTHSHGEEPTRTFTQIKRLIESSALSEWVKEKAVAVFQRIAVAEGKIHGVAPEQVHFHEVGAIDSIVDIVGACVALELLERPRLLASAVVEGSGWIDSAHGRLPIPAPATLEILGARGIPLSQCDERNELVTPTGAALLAELVERFGPMENLMAGKIGFGLGTRENRTRPNVLRVILAETEEGGAVHDWEIDRVAVLEANLDDISGEVLGWFVDTALGAGALDVFHTPIQMKKNRPGVLLTILCAPAEADRFAELMLKETGSFGVRRYTTERRKLAREFTTVQTAFGEISVKMGRLDGRVLHATPEFESCQKAAAAANVPLKLVYEAAIKATNPVETRR